MQRIDLGKSLAGHMDVVPKTGFEPVNSYENRS